jgi:hypothetical protein
VVPHWYSSTHRIAYQNRFGIPAVAPLYYQADPYVISTWWEEGAMRQEMNEKTKTRAPRAEKNEDGGRHEYLVLHFEAGAADPHALWRGGHYLCGDPVRAGRPGGAAMLEMKGRGRW